MGWGEEKERERDGGRKGSSKQQLSK